MSSNWFNWFTLGAVLVLYLDLNFKPNAANDDGAGDKIISREKFSFHSFIHNLTKMPLIYPRPTFTYGLLSGDDELYALLLDLHSWQHRVRSAWICSRDYVCNDVSSGSVRVCLLDHDGEPTVMPDYMSYDKAWVTAGFYKNPFEVQWLDYRKDSLTSRYLVSVIETLDEQAVMWAADSNTKGCLAFENFDKFTDCLKRLYEYDVVGSARTDANLGGEEDGDTASLTDGDSDF